MSESSLHTHDPQQSSGRDGTEATHAGRVMAPAVDIFESPKSLTLLADMPGVAPDNLEIDLNEGEIGLHSTPLVARDYVIVGGAMREGATIETHNNTKGLVRAFDVRTGRMVWRFDTIPRPGQPGNETWENNSWAENGNVGVWTQIAADEELGLVYLPVETPSSDYYGGHRPGDNLYAESLVAVDLDTGEMGFDVCEPIFGRPGPLRRVGRDPGRDRQEEGATAARGVEHGSRRPIDSGGGREVQEPFGEHGRRVVGTALGPHVRRQ